MAKSNYSIPLCVDLDGTLIATDTLFESILLAVKRKPYIILFLPFWLLSGRSHLKSRIADIAIPQTDLLPYNEDIIEYIQIEKNKGRKIILTTATQKKVADLITNNLNLFDDCIASDNEVNLRSSRKADYLVEKFGLQCFDYIGNSFDDLKVWEKANKAILKNPSESLIKRAKKINNNIEIIETRTKSFLTYIKQIRVHQWLKNVLIFLPMLMAHKIESTIILDSVFAFFSFSFIASFVYILNDLMDLESDRKHPYKKNRPLAAGMISIPKATLISIGFFISGFILSIITLNIEFTYILLLYFIITTTYSFYLKKIIVIDIITLSCLYTIRLIAGASATNVEASQWLLGFSIFFFLSLAIMKRFTELKDLKEKNKNESSGRGYKIEDIHFLQNIGPASGYLSILIFSLYLNSGKVVSLYNYPKLLWIIALCLLYWISRMWIISHRGKMHDDPIVFTAKDKVSYVVGLIIVVLSIGASL